MSRHKDLGGQNPPQPHPHPPQNGAAPWMGADGFHRSAMEKGKLQRSAKDASKRSRQVTERAKGTLGAQPPPLLYGAGGGDPPLGATDS